MNANKQMQEKYVMLKSLRQQLEKTNEQFNAINEQLESIEETIDNLRQISVIKEDSTILVPISNGVFIEAKVTNCKDFLVNIGSSTVIKKDIIGIEEILLNQKKELFEVQVTINQDKLGMEKQVELLQKELKLMIGE